VINSVLDLAQSESGKITLNAENLDISGLLAECAQNAATQCERANLHFTAKGLDRPLSIFGDKSRLQQIFTNLLANAVKFNKPGGSVSLAAWDDGKTVTVEIVDSGIGMMAAEVEVALTPFSQVDARLERKYEGAGLGLPLSNAFIEAHNGTLEIQSAAGAGTKISIGFPHSAAESVRLAG
jgi:signal transduction histidine kinase